MGRRMALDEDADFAAMYETHFQTVVRSPYLATNDLSLAEEAAQESFARALERWSRLRGAPWAPAWVARTAMNYGLRMARRRTRERASVTRSVDDAPSVELDIALAVRSLPRRQREAITLHYLVDLPIAEVARAMRCSEGAVKTHLHRARQALRIAVEPTR